MDLISLTNTTGRLLNLGGAVQLKPGERVDLAKDARYILDRPIFKSYEKSGDIKVDRKQVSGKQKMTADKKLAEEKS